jgi:hypothetical protein
MTGPRNDNKQIAYPRVENAAARLRALFFRSCTPTPDMFGSIISNASGSKAGKVLFFMIKFLNPQCQCLRKYFLHEETLVRLP